LAATAVSVKSIAMTWKIRAPTPADLEELADIYLAVRRETFTWVEPFVFRHQDFFAHTRGEAVWLAENGDGEIAGFMTLWAPDQFIHMLYIRKQFQGQGIGTALLQALPDWQDRPYRLKCLVRNQRAKAFYRANGFVVTGTGTSAEGDYEEMTFFPPE
jgi:GNAT superfamily N-acetyltransferase